MIDRRQMIAALSEQEKALLELVHDLYSEGLDLLVDATTEVQLAYYDGYWAATKKVMQTIGTSHPRVTDTFWGYT